MAMEEKVQHRSLKILHAKLKETLLQASFQCLQLLPLLLLAAAFRCDHVDLLVQERGHRQGAKNIAEIAHKMALHDLATNVVGESSEVDLLHFRVSYCLDRDGLIYYAEAAYLVICVKSSRGLLTGMLVHVNSEVPFYRGKYLLRIKCMVFLVILHIPNASSRKCIFYLFHHLLQWLVA